MLFALFGKAVFLGEVFYQRDIHLIFLGQTETFVRAVLGGSWPVWDPYPGFGQPMLANPDTQVLYPPTWLNLLMAPTTYYTLFVIGHLLFTALGVRAVALSLGVSRAGALVAAVLWILSGPMLSLLNVWHHFAGAAWIPWVLLAADRAARTGRRADTVLWGGAMASQVLAGSADMVAMTLPLALAMVALRHRASEPAPLPLTRLAWIAVAAGVLALALSAGLWLPTLDVAMRSERWHLPSETRTTWSVHPVSLLQAVLPLPLQDLPLSGRWRAALFESREPFLMSIYLGALTLGLAASAFAGARRPGRGLLATCAVVATLSALGKHTPFHDLISTIVFPLRLLRYPSKAMILTAFAASVLAGMGYDAWRAAPARDARRFRRVVSVPLVGLALLAGAAALAVFFGAPAVGRFILDPDTSGARARAVLTPMAARLLVVGAGCLLAAGLASARSARPTASAAAVAVLAGLDLWSAHRSLNPTVPPKVLTYRPATLDSIDQRDHSRLYVYEYFGVTGKSDRYLAHVSPEEQRRLRGRWPYPYADVIAHRTYLLPPAGEIFGLYGSYDMDMRGLYPVTQGRLALLLRGIEETPGHLRLLRIGAVSRVIAYHTDGFEELTPLATLPSLRPEPIHVFAVPRPVPRVYVVSGARVADGRDAFADLVDPDFDPLREVILAQGAPSPPDPAFTGAARIVELKADRIRLDVELSTPGHAVLVDAFDPGWRATVDGVDARVLRANVAFRAVAVGAGRHAVELVYRPRPLLWGLAITGASLLAAVALAASARGGAAR